MGFGSLFSVDLKEGGPFPPFSLFPPNPPLLKVVLENWIALFVFFRGFERDEPLSKTTKKKKERDATSIPSLLRRKGKEKKTRKVKKRTGPHNKPTVNIPPPPPPLFLYHGSCFCFFFVFVSRPMSLSSPFFIIYHY